MPVRPPVFRSANAPTSRDVDRDRGTARERGYSRRWDVVALAYRREHSLCLGCRAVGRVSPSDVVDHIIPHRGDQALFWDRGNWQPSCQWHHDVIKQKLEAMWAGGRAQQADLRLDSPLAISLTKTNQ